MIYNYITAMVTWFRPSCLLHHSVFTVEVKKVAVRSSETLEHGHAHGDMA
jgi:hypothetical protein